MRENSNVESKDTVANLGYTESRALTSYYLDNYRRQRSCEGYVFTPVCHSVHKGVLPQCMLGCQPQWTMQHPQDQAHHPPGPCTSPGPGTPPEMGTAADGTHPTEMHSCLFLKSA